MSCINMRAPCTPRAAQQPAAQPVEVIGEGIHDGQSGVDLQPTGDRQLLVDDLLEPGPVAADDPSLPRGGGALVETDRLDPLRPAGVPDAQVLVELEQRPPLQDLRRRDVALAHRLTLTCRRGRPVLGP